jgi:hypothetical protein
MQQPGTGPYKAQKVHEKRTSISSLVLSSSYCLLRCLYCLSMLDAASLAAAASSCAVLSACGELGAKPRAADKVGKCDACGC